MLLVVIGIVIFYLFRSEPFSWRTYTNAESKLSIQHPRSWKVERSDLPFTTLFTFSRGSYSFYLYRYEVQNARDYVEKNMKNSKKESINGLEAFHLTDEMKGDVYMIFSESHAYLAEIPKADRAGDTSTARKIVESLKLTN